jgi:hypothetical protein
MLLCLKQARGRNLSIGALEVDFLDTAFPWDRADRAEPILAQAVLLMELWSCIGQPKRVQACLSCSALGKIIAWQRTESGEWSGVREPDTEDYDVQGLERCSQAAKEIFATKT